MLDFADFELLAVELLLAASLVAIAARYLRLPYTVALVGAGFLISFGQVFEVSMSRDLILLVFLPPLLFEGAINMDLGQLRRRWDQVALLALAGTLITAGVVAVCLVVVADLPWKYGLLLAVMLAPTDPVSVLATMKENRVATGLRTLLEGESVFNDALGIVLFTIALSFAFPDNPGHGAGWTDALGEFGFELTVGVGVGLATGYAAHHVMRLLDDHLAEITLSVALAFGSFLVADRLGGSGVMAVVVGGLLIGNFGTDRAMSARSRTATYEFWEVVAFLMNSTLFLLIGLAIEVKSLGESATAIAVGVATVALFAGRALAVYGLLWPFRRGPATKRIPVGWQHAVYWGGLRGSIPIALALGLTGQQRILGEVDAVAAVFAAVFISLVLQGVTFSPLLGKLNLARREARRGGERGPGWVQSD